MDYLPPSLIIAVGSMRRPLLSYMDGGRPLNYHSVTGVGMNGSGVCDMGLLRVCTYLYLAPPTHKNV